MAKLSEYPIKTAADNSDLIPLVDAGGNKNISKENLMQGLPTAESVQAAADSAQAAAIAAGFGVGQSWQDVLASRQLSTTYTNTTGKLIKLFVRTGFNTSVDNIKAYIDGMLFLSCQVDYTNGSGSAYELAVDVPAGSEYEVVSPLKGVAIWREFR